MWYAMKTRKAKTQQKVFHQFIVQLLLQALLHLPRHVLPHADTCKYPILR